MNCSRHDAARDLPAPQYEITFTGTPIVDSILFFHTSAPEGVSYLWSFGDGDSSNNYTPAHLYKDTGSFTVTLKLKNSPGGSASKEIVITRTPGTDYTYKIAGMRKWRHIYSDVFGGSGIDTVTFAIIVADASTVVTPYASRDTLRYYSFDTKSGVLEFFSSVLPYEYNYLYYDINNDRVSLSVRQHRTLDSYDSIN